MGIMDAVMRIIMAAGLLLGAGLAPATAQTVQAGFYVGLQPDTETVPARAPLSIDIDARYLGDSFRRVEIFANDTRIELLESPRTSFEDVLLPPGTYELRFEAINQAWWREAATRRLTVSDPDFSVPAALSSFDTFSVERWNAAYLGRYPLDEPPFETYDPNWDGDDLAWNMGYWLRAYVTMARLTGSRFYLDKAGQLAYLMLEASDEARAARGELDVQAVPYDEGPDPLFADRTLAAPGWRHLYRGGPEARPPMRIEVLIDGHIANHIMLYVDLVLSDDRFAAHAPFARQAMAYVIRVIDFHDSMWIDDRYPTVPGSYYYSNGEGGKWSNPVVFNHAATMLAAALLVDKHRPTPVYRDRARRLVGYFMNYVKEVNGGYVWDYDPYVPERKVPAQDFGHATMDIEFLVLAHQRGIEGITPADFRKMARTLRSSIAYGEGNVHYYINGTERQIEPWVIDSAALGWLDLAAYDPAVFPVIERVFTTHKAVPGWERSFLGWANLMDWHVRLDR